MTPTAAQRRTRLLRLVSMLTAPGLTEAMNKSSRRAAMLRGQNVLFAGDWGFRWQAAPGEAPCGTSACVLGWAAMLPTFMADGLIMRWQFRLGGDEYAAQYGEPCLSLATAEEVVGIEAGRRFFGLTAAESRKLFSAGRQGAQATLADALAARP